MAQTVWDETLNAFNEALAEPKPMPAGVAAAAVTASIGLSLFLKVLEIASKKQPIPDLADAARGFQADLKAIPARDGESFSRYRADKQDRKVAEETIRVPLEAARFAAGGVELCAKALDQIGGMMAADLRAAAGILHAAAHAMLECANANLRLMELEENTRAELLDEFRHTAEKTDASYALIKFSSL